MVKQLTYFKYLGREFSENSTYIYFKGKFVNNKPVETSTHKRENISLNEIYQIMKGKHFNESVDLHEK